MLSARFITVLWGEEYINNFLQYSLPSQLGIGNIQECKFSPKSDYLIMSDEKGISVLKNHINIKRLAQSINVTFFDISSIPRHNKLMGLSHCQHEGLIRSQDFDVVLFVYPDFIVSTGTISYIFDKLEKGYDSVVFPVPRILDSCLDDPEFNDCICETAIGKSLSIAPRQLVNLCFKYNHPNLDGNFLNGELKNVGLAYLQWKVNSKTWLLHCFHLHPVAFRVKKEDPIFRMKFDISLDEELFPKLFDDISKMDFPSHSDYFAMCSISKISDAPLPTKGKINLFDILAYAEAYTSITHREMFGKQFVWSSQSSNELKNDIIFQNLSKKAIEVVEITKNYLNRPDSILELEEPNLYKQRLYQQKRFLTKKTNNIYEFVETKKNQTNLNDFDELAIQDKLKKNSKQISDRDLLANKKVKDKVKSYILFFGIWLKDSTPLSKLKYYPKFIQIWLKIKIWLQN